MVDLNWTICLWRSLLSLKNYHTTYREKQALWNLSLAKDKLRFGGESGLKYRALGWAEAVLVSSWDVVGNKKCEIPFHHTLSARSLGSIYSCGLAEPILFIPSLFAFSSPSVQAREEPKHSFSGPCSDVLPSSHSKCGCGKGIPTSQRCVPY